jgi:uncharacterized protein YndB with AHSA1/START domain
MVSELNHQGTRIETEAIVLGTVVVQAAVQGSASTVYAALTEPEQVAAWFGTLTTPMCVGETTRLDLGDGDFFTLETLKLEKPSVVEYLWRFLGMGPLNTITFQVIPQDVGCCVRVFDREANRSQEAAAELKEGWIDFMQRLAAYLATGQISRYEWRQDVDGSIELPTSVSSAYEVLFAAGNLQRWLPLDQPDLEDGATLQLTDGSEPARVHIFQVAKKAPISVTFYLTDPTWKTASTCGLSLTEKGAVTGLSFKHQGWTDIGPDAAYQFQQRKRFCTFWVEAMQRAARLISSH